MNSRIKMNKNGNLSIADCDVKELAGKYGTPLYIISEDHIRDNIRLYKEAMRKNFGENFDIAYASKAFCTSYMYKILMQENISADVVSAGEIFTALNVGFNPGKLYFHGSNKSYDELVYAIDNNIGRIIVDNTQELLMLDEIAGCKNKKVNIMLRIKPGIEAHTHEFIKTGHIDCKFGSSIQNNEALEITRLALSLKNINLVGLHCHIGSQIFDSEPFVLATQVMSLFMDKIHKELAHKFTELNLGGGFGIRYTDDDNPKTPMENISAIRQVFKGDYIPKIIIEPGRSIVGEAGTTAYTVGAIKEIDGVRNYVSIDGGITDNPRFALYKAKYKFILANNPSGLPSYNCAIAGKCCESGDMLATDINIAKPVAGDILCVLSTGAYNYSMASNYNKLLKPAVVIVSSGKDKLIVRRETHEDLIKNDRIED